jgi:hypothetical protein
MKDLGTTVPRLCGGWMGGKNEDVQEGRLAVNRRKGVETKKRRKNFFVDVWCSSGKLWKIFLPLAPLTDF